MFETIELQRKLMEARGEDPDRKIKARIAKVQQRHDDIKLLSEHSDLCTAKIADTLDIPVSYVEIEKDRIAKEEKQRREFMSTGQRPEHPRAMAHVSIFK